MSHIGPIGNGLGGTRVVGGGVGLELVGNIKCSLSLANGLELVGTIKCSLSVANGLEIGRFF